MPGRGRSAFLRAKLPEVTKLNAFLVSFGIIFVAELGDKSQLMAMTFAARYRASVILAAITTATAVVHLSSVVVGAAPSRSTCVQEVTLSSGPQIVASVRP